MWSELTAAGSLGLYWPRRSGRDVPQHQIPLVFECWFGTKPKSFTKTYGSVLGHKLYQGAKKKTQCDADPKRLLFIFKRVTNTPKFGCRWWSPASKVKLNHQLFTLDFKDMVRTVNEKMFGSQLAFKTSGWLKIIDRYFGMVKNYTFPERATAPLLWKQLHIMAHLTGLTLGDGGMPGTISAKSEATG